MGQQPQSLVLGVVLMFGEKLFLYIYVYIYIYIYTHIYMIEGSLEVKLPTIWTDEKQSREEAERRER